MLLAHELIGHPDDPALILIHGITDTRHMWDPLLDALAAGRYLLTVDLRGHGESEDDDSSYDPAAYAADVIETAMALGVHDAIVVGHSLGGIVATALAAAAPCTAVVNIDQPLRLSAFKEGLGQLESMLKGDKETFTEALALLFSAMDGPLPAGEQERLQAHRSAKQHVVLGTWATVFDSSVEELDATVEAMAAAVKVPYLAVHGIDPGVDYAAWLMRLIPTAGVELWADHGHYPHLVAQDRFLARLAAFEALVRA
ncbi:MAG: alpha/beta fold hydrolase [Actinomycetota bacterium]|nr:alpha/beta fold hydrolase [Actinomycetota bacterium]